MEEREVQVRINSAFINSIASSAFFTTDELVKIEKIINSRQKPDKMAEELLKSIGGSDDENT